MNSIYELLLVSLLSFLLFLIVLMFKLWTLKIVGKHCTWEPYVKPCLLLILENVMSVTVCATIINNFI